MSVAALKNDGVVAGWTICDFLGSYGQMGGAILPTPGIGGPSVRRAELPGLAERGRRLDAINPSRRHLGGQPRPTPIWVIETNFPTVDAAFLELVAPPIGEPFI